MDPNREGQNTVIHAPHTRVIDTSGSRSGVDNGGAPSSIYVYRPAARRNYFGKDYCGWANLVDSVLRTVLARCRSAAG